MAINTITIVGSAVAVAQRLGFVGELQPLEFDTPEFQSRLGTAVYSFVRFERGEYTQLDGLEVSYPEVVLTSVIVTAQQAKNIVKTDIQGRNGTIKEYISDSDFIVNIDGAVVSDSARFPFDELSSLKQVLESPEAVTITCPFLQALNLPDTFVVENYTIKERVGYRNTIDISISLLSDLIPVNESFEI